MRATREAFDCDSQASSWIDRRFFGAALIICVGFLSLSNASAFEPVVAKLETDSAWTGQGIRILVTLYSPGPFEGAAKFELPELPRSLFVRGGSPTVGSESLGGTTYFTQRHELTLFTQRSGTIEIPAFKVQFSGKESFTSEPVMMGGTTDTLSFESKRPPGTDEREFVLAAADLKATQSWRPDTIELMTAGDVIQRIIEQRAMGTTAMMISPVDSAALEGIRVYDSEPIVEDRSERGESTATRIDAIRYQFEGAGTFSIPEIEVVWWDTESGQIRVQRLDGKVVEVRDAGPPADSRTGEERGSSTSIMFWILGVGLPLVPLSIWLIRRHRARSKSPESTAAKRLVRACRTEDAMAAYDAWLAWKRIAAIHEEIEIPPALDRQTESLRRLLFGKTRPADAWSGHALLREFGGFRRHVFHARSKRAVKRVLPELNSPA